MSIPLATLASRLQADVPAESGAPSSTQYELAVKAAVDALSHRYPRVAVATLSLISGQAAYDLPADFLRVIRMSGYGLSATNDVLVTGQGIIPIRPGYGEKWAVSGKRITFSPTPMYSGTRQVEYAASHALDNTSAYPDLDEQLAGIVMLKATANILRVKTIAAGAQAFSYSIGDESVDKGGVARSLAAAVESYDKAFDEAVKRLVGSVGSKAVYSPW